MRLLVMILLLHPCVAAATPASAVPVMSPPDAATVTAPTADSPSTATLSAGPATMTVFAQPATDTAAAVPRIWDPVTFVVDEDGEYGVEVVSRVGKFSCPHLISRDRSCVLNTVPPGALRVIITDPDGLPVRAMLDLPAGSQTIRIGRFMVSKTAAIVGGALTAAGAAGVALTVYSRTLPEGDGARSTLFLVGLPTAVVGLVFGLPSLVVGVSKRPLGARVDPGGGRVSLEENSGSLKFLGAGAGPLPEGGFAGSVVFAW
ncbi:MAG: hypothetical protein GMKNLPBB_02826 [Myxococcota bacterium]|nr:hypothetical protein [Myxococcota bacterium]